MFTVSRFAKSNHLPTLPQVAMRFVELAQQDEPDYGEIIRVIRSDPAVSGKILRTVNSALFGFRRKVDSIEQAVPILGLTLLRTIILSFHLSNHSLGQSNRIPVFQRHWRSSLTQAVLSELIAEELGDVDPPSCFLAGMLQDIGILAMLVEAPEDYVDGVMAHTSFPNVVAAERSHFGFSHVDVSVEILKQWGLYSTFGSPIEHHHDHLSRSDNAQEDRMDAILQAANLGATLLLSDDSETRSLSFTLDQWVGFLKDRLGLSQSQSKELVQEVNFRVNEYSVLFNFQIDEGVETQAVVAAAKDMLEEIALKNQLELMANPRNARRKNLEEELNLDELSGLHNRRFMNRYLDERLAKHVEEQKPLAILFIDIDKFKRINDGHGHAAGDLAIKHVADWLTSSLRNEDMAIRLGGDEFLVVLQINKEDDFSRVANRIVSDIPELQLANQRRLEITLSVGCVYYQPVPGDAVDANWLIDQADRSMYDVKNRGGDSFAIQKLQGTSRPTAMGEAADSSMLTGVAQTQAN